ncbi:MAG TPA: DNA replication/repair protein RecF [Acidimicrobiales bacterium]|nr:DNA replication/repair protein RecF [Acidimicrobiales bacterium]
MTIVLHLQQLVLVDFRSYAQLEVAFPPGRVALIGPNGIGKTNLLEAIAWLATMQSFRGSPASAVVRETAAIARVRGELHHDRRGTTIDAELAVRGPGRVTVNGKRLARASDLLGHVRVTVFSPDDLQLLKGGPSERRRFVDELLVALDAHNDVRLSDFERILRHRNALLRQSNGRLDTTERHSLTVWNDKLAPAADVVGELRRAALTQLAPLVVEAYRDISGEHTALALDYHAPWMALGMAEALAAAERDDLRRGVTTVGPHRDEVEVLLEGLPARTHASQGEQRSLALALRLAQHRLVGRETAVPPLLLLDDVFSELDRARAGALIAHLPMGQAFMSSAVEIPAEAEIEQVFDVGPGHLVARATPSGSRRSGR